MLVSQLHRCLRADWAAFTRIAKTLKEYAENLMAPCLMPSKIVLDPSVSFLCFRLLLPRPQMPIPAFPNGSLIRLAEELRVEAKSLVPIVSGRAARALEPPRSLSANLGRPLVARDCAGISI